jgi:hypothetical protein
MALSLALAANQNGKATPLERLRAKVDVVSVPNLSASEVAGQYTNPSEELRKLIVPMGSDNLFIFPDKTYIFTIVSDIPPDTISDKGTWNLDTDILQLESDKDITWKSKMVDRRHIVVRRHGRDGELFLVGLDSQLPQFERTAGHDADFTFLLLSLKREKAISAEDAGPLRKKLMSEKWNPRFYN